MARSFCRSLLKQQQGKRSVTWKGLFKITNLFVRIKDYDNSACIRKPLLPEDAIHAWAINEDTLKYMQRMYGAEKVDVMDVPEGKKVYAIAFHELDDYVTGEHDDMPDLVEFDSRNHLMTMRCNDYQVVFLNDRL